MLQHNRILSSLSFSLSPLTGRARAEGRQRATWGMALGLVTALATLLLLSNHPVGWSLEHDTLDFWFALRSPASPSDTHSSPPRRVVVLAADEATLRRWRGRVFDARDIERLLRELKRQDVAAVALAWPGLTDSTVLDAAQEPSLARVIAAQGTVLLPLNFNADATAGAPIAGAPATGAASAGASRSSSEARARARIVGRAAQRFSLDTASDPSGDYRPADGPLRLHAPPLPLLRAASGAGHIAFTLDGDGRVRRLPLLLEYNGRRYPALSLAAALRGVRPRAGSAPSAPAASSTPRDAAIGGSSALSLSEGDGSVEIGGGPLAGRRIPLLPDGTMLLNFHPGERAAHGTSGPGLSAKTGEMVSSRFTTISIAAALADPRRLRGLRGHCVVIGPTAAGATSLFSTPTGARMPAAALHAIAIDNILRDDVIERAPGLWTWLLTILLCVTVGGFVAARPPLWGGVVVLLSLAAVATLSLGLFAQNIWLDISAPWLATGLTFLSAVIGRARRQERESTRVGSTIEALGQVSDIIATQTHPQQLLDRVLQWTVNVMQAEGASALLLDAEGQTLRFTATTGPKSQELKPYTLRRGEGIAGWVAEYGEPAIVNDVARDPRFKSDIARSIGFPTAAILCVPLRVRDKMLGVIEVVNRVDGSPFNEDDAELLTAVANQAALVIENSRLYGMLNERVVQSESDLATTNHRLQAEKNTLQTVLQSMTDGVVVTDSAGFVQLINPAASALLPELAPEAIGRPLAQLLPDVVTSVLSVARAQGPEAIEQPSITNHQAPSADSRSVVQLQRGDIDTPRFIEAHSAPLQGEDGVMSGIVSVFADVTEKRGIEQAKSDFVSFVAHEMRSPLTSISGFSAMLQRQALKEPKDEGRGTRDEDTSNSSLIPHPSSPGDAARARFLGIIHNESERLTRLINNLLDVARIEAGRGIELQREAIDFATVAHEAVESQRAYSSRHRLVSAVPADLPPALADRDKVVQILINLLANALKYSPGGTVTVSARATKQFLYASVSDEGPGIAPEQRARLFQRFGRSPARDAGHNPGPGERAKPTGTGLGLFLTRHLVESHGGRIWVESEPGHGATFTFTLPLA